MSVRLLDCSNRSTRPDWAPPGLFSKIDSFDFTNDREHCVVRSFELVPNGHKIVEFVSSGHVSVTSEPERSTIVFPLVGQLSSQVDGTRVHVRSGEAVAFGPIHRRTRVETKTDHHYRSISVISPSGPEPVERSTLGAAMAPGRWGMAGRKTGLRAMTRYLLALLDGVETGSGTLVSLRARRAAEVLVDEYCSAVLSLDTPPGETGPVVPNRYFERARAFIDAHYSEPVSVAQIARASGVTTRTMRVAFAAAVAMTPRQALTEVRVHKAREMLENADETTTVARVAMDVGICHLGRFSGYYQSRFGELPSETLKRARGGDH